MKGENLFWSLDVDSYNVKKDLNKIVCEGVIYLINLTKNGIRSAGEGSGSCGHGSAPSNPLEGWDWLLLVSEEKIGSLVLSHIFKNISEIKLKMHYSHQYDWMGL
jgi:hypothetical protein